MTAGRGRLAGRGPHLTMVRMFGRRRFSHWLIGVGLLAALEGATVLTLGVASVVPAQAQTMDQRYPFLRRQHQRSGGGGLFQNLFGGFEQQPRSSGRERQPSVQSREHADYSRAPAPRKPEADAPPPTTTIVVMGDGMADWLAYGLEDAFSDAPEVGIVRESKAHSGLLRYQWRSDLDWWHVARDELAKQKANYVVMMLGVSDRQNISEKDVAKQAEKEQQAAQSGQDQTKPGQTPPDNADQSASATPEHKYPRGVIPFRTDRWAKVYSHRIDETIAALKSKGVPVFWVGLPSIRGTRSTADAVYLNDLYRARAERAGITYIDIWDGFVDDNGKYSSYGPDYEGQTRKLRSADGVFFTKYGARKLAHYVEREIRRYMNNRAVVSLPTGPIAPVPNAGKSTERPLAGPVVPLTVAPSSADMLDGGPGMRKSAGNSIATRVLVKGDAVAAPPGRADDFAWPPGSDANKKAAPIAANTPRGSAAAVADAAPTAPAAKPAVPAPVMTAPSAKPVTPAPIAAPPAQAKASAEPVAPAERKPAEVAKPTDIATPEPVEARKPRAHQPEERTAQSRPPRSHPVPPEPVRQRPTHRRSDNPFPSLFGRDGPFGWMR